MGKKRLTPTLPRNEAEPLKRTYRALTLLIGPQWSTLDAGGACYSVVSRDNRYSLYGLSGADHTWSQRTGMMTKPACLAWDKP